MKKLDKTISNEMRVLKATIMNLAKYYKPGNTEEETKNKKLEAFDKLFGATSTVGKLIKDTAQDMRWESQRFLATIFDEVAAEADTRIEKLDSLIDSGIQELGMKWAWKVDGVTYKDWDRYQDLKKEFSGIQTKIVQAAEKNKRLVEITNWAEGDAWEGGANTRAKEVAEELARIKRIAKKKIELNDYSEDFSDKYLNQESKDAKDSVEALKENAKAAPSKVASMMAPPPAVENILNSASYRLQEIVEIASEKVYGREKGTFEEVTSVVGEAYGSAASKVSEAVYRQEVSALDSAASMISEVAKSASSEISIAVNGIRKRLPEEATSVIAEDVEAATSITWENLEAANTAVSGALYGKEEEKYYTSIVESAGARLQSAVESARAKLSEIYEEGRKAGGEKLDEMVRGVKEVVGEVGEAANRAGEEVKEKYEGVKDEL